MNNDHIKKLEEHFRGYAWDYFSHHADQRMKAFHFYILFSTAVMGAFVLLLKNQEMHKWMSIFGFLLLYFSFVFWKLDVRTRQLVKNGENALKHLDALHELADQESLPNPLCLFAREEAVSNKLPLYPLISGHFSYARCFKWVFLIFALLGMGIFILCLALFPI